MKSQRPALLLIALLALSIVASAKQANTQIAPQVLTEILRAANAGDTKAQSEMGARYTFGRDGVEQDYGEAAKWDLKAASQGDLSAQFRLATKYILGQGVPKSETEAVKWGRKAADQGLQLYLLRAEILLKFAEQGDAGAPAALGTIYSMGLNDSPKDYVAAAKWLKVAAAQGDAVSQMELGIAYLNGDGIPQDYLLAHMWLNLAAAALPPGSNSEVVRLRNVAVARMSSQQVAEAQRMAREWKPIKAMPAKVN